MKYDDLFDKDEQNILITGDSLAYNRYGYDMTPRTNAYDCGVGMPSWSFSLRDRIYLLDKQFVYGEQIAVDCPCVDGIDHISAVPHTAMFGGRIKTLYPQKDVSFSVPIKGNRIVLYLQRRLENHCVFDVYVDGTLAAADVDTKGDVAEFAGYGLMTLALPCDANLDEHKVSFVNIRGNSPKITIAGVGTRHYNISLTGKGSMCTDFFVENFEERIGQYKPDLLILSLGGNDRVFRTIVDVHNNLITLFSKIFSCVPQCKVLLLLPTSSHDPAHPEQDVPYTSLMTAEVYNRAMEAVCQNFGQEGYTNDNVAEGGVYDIDTLRISDLFDNDDVASWRFDNIHMSPHGNSVLLDAVCKRLGIACQ